MNSGYLSTGFKVKLLRPEAKLPTCAHPGEDLGYDLYSATRVEIPPGEVRKIATGIAVELPGHGFQIRERSSYGIIGVHAVGGVIDSGYRGEIFVNLLNSSKETVWTAVGDKIANMIPVLVRTIFEPEEVQELTETSRGSGGYGSSGR